MCFMHTGFSKQIVALLAEQKVKYTSFDILGDEEVRQGLYQSKITIVTP